MEKSKKEARGEEVESCKAAAGDAMVEVDEERAIKFCQPLANSYETLGHGTDRSSAEALDPTTDNADTNNLKPDKDNSKAKKLLTCIITSVCLLMDCLTGIALGAYFVLGISLICCV